MQEIFILNTVLAPCCTPNSVQKIPSKLLSVQDNYTRQKTLHREKENAVIANIFIPYIAF